MVLRRLLLGLTASLALYQYAFAAFPSPQTAPRATA